jgi:hypothetical protein
MAHDPCDEGRRLIDEYRVVYAEHPVGPFDVRVAGAEVRHVIALLPDPVESERAHDFDATLEGVEEAVAAGTDAGAYVRDRSWLPWPGVSGGKRRARCWEREPGVILYRPTDPIHQPAIAVLLVGETPTWGIRTAQLEAALALVGKLGAEWSSGPGPWGRPEVRILGPTFSGSAASLAAVLDGALSRRRAEGSLVDISVASGTASNPAVASTVQGVADRVAPEPERERGSRTPEGSGPERERGSTVRYWSAIPDDERLLDAMLDFICQRGGSCDGQAPTNIALLAESLTTYGSAGARERAIQLAFPPNLAAIRRAYEAAAADPSAALDTADASATAADTTRSTAAAGSESAAETATSHDLALGAALRELSERHVRFVGLVATDATDVVFLAERIRAQLPDVRLFTIGADIRYLRPDYAGALNGMLVVHTTPTASDTGDVRSGRRSTLLQNDLVRNVFHAGRYLLSGHAAEPSVRISLVGNGGLWEIGGDSGAAASRPHLRVPVSWWFVFALALGVLAIVLVLVLSPWLATTRLGRKLLDPARSMGFLHHRGRLYTLVGPCEHTDLATEDRFVTASLLSVVAGAPLLMLVALLSREGERARPGLAVFCGVLSVAAITTMWSRALPALARREEKAWATAVLPGLATVGTLVALGLGCGPQHEATFNLLSGGSPVLGGLIGLGIFALGLWCWRIRLRFLDTHSFGPDGEQRFSSMTPPIAKAVGGSDTGLDEVERRLLCILQSPWVGFRAVPVAVHVLLLVSLLVPVCLKPPQTYEPTWRNVLMVVFGVLALLPMAGNLARLLATSVAFARLLRRLAAFPFVEALGRLPPRLARPLEAQLGISGSEVADLVPAVEALETVADTLRSFEADYNECAALLDAELRYEAGPARSKRADPNEDAGPARSKRADPNEDAGPARSKRADPNEPAPSHGGRRARLTARLLDTSSRLAWSRDRFGCETRAAIDDFVAALVGALLPRYVRHFRLFVPPLVIGSMLCVAMTSLYFIQPQRLITSLIFVWVAGIVLVVFVVYVALDRDPVMSAMTGTTPGVITWNGALLRRVVAWGVFPLGSLLAAQYPAFAYWIATILGSIAKGFR